MSISIIKEYYNIDFEEINIILTPSLDIGKIKFMKYKNTNM